MCTVRTSLQCLTIIRKNKLQLQRTKKKKVEEMNLSTSMYYIILLSFKPSKSNLGWCNDRNKDTEYHWGSKRLSGWGGPLHIGNITYWTRCWLQGCNHVGEFHSARWLVHFLVIYVILSKSLKQIQLPGMYYVEEIQDKIMFLSRTLTLDRPISLPYASKTFCRLQISRITYLHPPSGKPCSVHRARCEWQIRL